ncbi:MAG: HD domain-containing phosphohydrolase [Massilia sp.]
MAAISLGTAVNPFFLARLMRLALARSVLASDDIVDQFGVLLLARGARMLPGHQAALAGRFLTRPLEASLQLVDAVDTGALVASAEQLLANSAPLAAILRAGGDDDGRGALALLARARLGAPLRLLIEMSACEADAALDDGVRVALLSAGMARSLGLDEDGQLAACLAGLLHDIGELLLDPRCMAPGQRLAPRGWAELVTHPRLGQLLVNELDTLPLAVGRAVAEHHERVDGSGYPHQLRGLRCSAPGQAVAAADMIAGFFDKDSPLERAELALKIVPGEQSRPLLAAVSNALRNGPAAPIGTPVAVETESAGRLCTRIAASIQQCELLLDNQPAHIRSLANEALARIRTLERAFVSTGLDAYLHHKHGADGKLLFEKTVATREIVWRLRHIARQLALHADGSDAERRAFAALIALLDNEVPAARVPSTAQVTPIRPVARVHPELNRPA